MRNKKSNDLRKIVAASALALTIAATAFVGTNNLVFAAATQPETIPTNDTIQLSQVSVNTVPDGYQAPNLW